MTAVGISLGTYFCIVTTLQAARSPFPLNTNLLLLRFTGDSESSQTILLERMKGRISSWQGWQQLRGTCIPLSVWLSFLLSLARAFLSSLWSLYFSLWRGPSCFFCLLYSLIHNSCPLACVLAYHGSFGPSWFKITCTNKR